MKSGFSLIELLVVVAIIGALAGAGIVGYQAYLAGVNTDVAVNNGEQLNRAMATDLFSINNNIAAQSDIFSGTGLTATDTCEDFALQMVIQAQSTFGGDADTSPVTDNHIAIYGPHFSGNADYPNEEPIGDQIVIFCNDSLVTPQDDNFVIRTCVCDDPTNTDSINGLSCGWTAACPQPW